MTVLPFRRHKPATLELATREFSGEARIEGTKAAVPWTLEVSEEQLIFEGLELLIPGYTCIEEYSRPERRAKATKGIPTISYDPARVSGNFKNDLLHSEDLHTRTAESVLGAVREVLASNRQIPHRNLIDTSRIVLSPHSMGGFPATDLATRHPGSIEAIVYKSAANFSEPTAASFFRPQMLLKLCKEKEDYRLAGNLARAANLRVRESWYLLHNPAQSLGEAATCLFKDQTERVAALQGKILMAYLGFENDPIVEVGRVEASARQGVGDNFHVLAGVGHLAPQYHPTEVADASWQIYQDLNQPHPTASAITS